MAIKTDKISASTREMSNVMAPPGLISVKQTILKTPKSLFNVGKIPDDRGLYALPTIPDFADISDIDQSLSQIFPIISLMERDVLFICDRGTGAKQFLGSKSIADGRRLSRWYKFELSLVENDRRPSQKPGTRRGRVRKIETFLILQISPRLSKTIGDIYDFEFSLVGKIWDGRETVKSKRPWPDHLGFSRHMRTRLKSCSLQNGF